MTINKQQEVKKGYAKYPNIILCEDAICKLLVGKNDEVFIFDADDYEKVKKFQWSVGGTKNHRYASNSVIGTYLHRYILGYFGSLSIDHINGDTYDNRKGNLRIVEHKNNIHNAQKYRKSCTSKYKGVCFVTERKKWKAAIHKGSTYYHLGLYLSEIDAAIAYNIAAKKYFGKFARLNAISEMRCSA
jgi:hypothetical protein